jgi:acyl carrier protein phosphodiesterase
MNFLAHFTLSFQHPEILLGQFIADAVKGRQLEGHQGYVKLGIEMHRTIDFATDTSEVCQELRKEFRPHLGLFSPVAIDMFLDHILARDFKNITGENLPQFANWVYSELAKRKSEIPSRMVPALEHMTTHNWLVNYASHEGLSRSIRGLSGRVSGGEALLPAIQLLPNLLNQVELTFNTHFPRLQTTCMNKFNTFANAEI